MANVTKTTKLKTPTPAVKAKAEPKKKEVAATTVEGVKAAARFIHMSPRKVRLVIDEIRGLDAQAAVDTLRFTNKAASEPVLKLLLSAIANASHNFSVEKQYLFVSKIIANDGPTIKRFRPRAHGSSAPIRKRMSHIELVLGIKPGAKIVRSTEKKEVKDATIVSPDKVKKDAPKNTTTNSGDQSGKGEKGFVKGMFQRKTG